MMPNAQVKFADDRIRSRLVDRKTGRLDADRHVIAKVIPGADGAAFDAGPADVKAMRVVGFEREIECAFWKMSRRRSDVVGAGNAGAEQQNHNYDAHGQSFLVVRTGSRFIADREFDFMIGAVARITKLASSRQFAADKSFDELRSQ